MRQIYFLKGERESFKGWDIRRKKNKSFKKFDFFKEW